MSSPTAKLIRKLMSSVCLSNATLPTSKGLPLTFTRPDLTKAQQEGGTFSEADVAWINPREFHRKAIAELENIGYNVARGNHESLELQKEIIGSKTGSVVSRIEGTKGRMDNGVITYKPHIRVGAISILFGFIFGILSVSYNAALILALLLIILGVYFLMRTRTSEFPIMFMDTIRILSVGEATERTVTKEGAEVTDLFAQLTVSFSGNLEAYAFLSSVKDESLRKAILNRVPNAAYPQPVKTSPLRPFFTTGADAEFTKEISTLSETVMKLAKTIESYGHKM